MKTFKGQRPPGEAIANLKELGCDVNTHRYDNNGSDYIMVSRLDKGEGVEYTFMYNTVSGRFSGNIDGNKMRFTNMSTEFDDEAWFAKIMEALYIPSNAEVA